MPSTLLDSIRAKTAKESRKKINKIRNLRLLLEPFREEIWTAFLAGCSRTQIFKELVERKEFYGSLETFRRIFKYMLPDANKLREINDIKIINKCSGLDENEIKKQMEISKLKEKQIDTNNNQCNKCNLSNTNKNIQNKKIKEFEKISTKNSVDKDNILNLTPEEKKEFFNIMVGNTPTDTSKGIKKIPENKNEQIQLNSLSPSEKIWKHNDSIVLDESFHHNPDSDAFFTELKKKMNSN